MQVRTAIVLCSLGSASCAAQPAVTHQVWLPSYAFGAIGGGDVDVRDYCPPGAMRELSIGSSFATLGVALATLGIYTPREVRIRCECSP